MLALLAIALGWGALISADSTVINVDPLKIPKKNHGVVAGDGFGDNHLLLASLGWSYEDFLHIPPPYALSKLQAAGLSSTNVFIANSTVSTAGRGLFSSRFLHEGDLAAIAPVCVLTMSEVYNAVNASKLVNYVWTEPDSLVGLLPFNNIAMINHPAYAHQEPNVFMTWFDWNSNEIDQTLSLSLEEILNNPTVLLDVALYAGRDISAGEELFIDYGATWSMAWSQFNAAGQQVNIFRQPMKLPEGFIPSQWKDISDY